LFIYFFALPDQDDQPLAVLAGRSMMGSPKEKRVILGRNFVKIVLLFFPKWRYIKWTPDAGS
jgi:hypothetical protein